MINKTPLYMQRATHYKNNFWYTRSLKIDREVILYSDLEYANFLTAEMNPNIVAFCEQPLEITISIDGKIEKSIFDMEVEYKDGKTELWEVKYMEDLEGTSKTALRSQHQIMKQSEWCKQNDRTYSVRTEKQIYCGDEYINNLSAMYHMLKRIDLEKAEYSSYELLKRIKPVDSIRIIDLSSNTFTKHEALYTVAYMLYKGYIIANIVDKEFNYETEVSYAD